MNESAKVVLVALNPYPPERHKSCWVSQLGGFRPGAVFEDVRYHLHAGERDLRQDGLPEIEVENSFGSFYQLNARGGIECRRVRTLISHLFGAPRNCRLRTLLSYLFGGSRSGRLRTLLSYLFGGSRSGKFHALLNDLFVGLRSCKFRTLLNYLFGSSRKGNQWPRVRPALNGT